MRIFVVLICSLGLVSVAYGAQQEENKQKKKQPQAGQHAAAPGGGPQKAKGHRATFGQPASFTPTVSGGSAAGAGAGSKKTSMGAYEGKKGQTSTRTYEGQTGKAAKGGKVTGAGKLT